MLPPHLRTVPAPMIHLRTDPAPVTMTTPVPASAPTAGLLPDPDTSTYPLAPASAPAARHHLRALLIRWNVPGHSADRAEQITGELVANAVRHGAPNPWHPALAELHEAARPFAALALGSRARVAMTVTRARDHVMVEVSDPSTARPYYCPSVSKLLMEDHPSAPLEEYGRGMVLVQSLAEVHGVYGAEDYRGPVSGKTVWAAVALETDWASMTYVVRAAGD